MRSAPTATVSRPPVARSCSRLSAMSASTLALRHSIARLSARCRSRATSVSCAGRALASRNNEIVTNRLSNIDQHPATGEHGEWTWPIHQNDLQSIDHAELEIRDAGEDLDDDDRRHQPENESSRSRRSGGYREEEGIGDQHRQPESQRQR